MRIFKSGKVYFIGAVAFFVVCLFSLSLTTINTGEVGIRVRFGKVVDSSTSEGINLKIPFIEKIEKINVKVQKIELDAASASRDLQDVNMSLAVNYRVNGDSAKELYKTVGSSYKDTVLEPAEFFRFVHKFECAKEC